MIPVNYFTHSKFWENEDKKRERAEGLKKGWLCPVCEQSAVRVCDCMLFDSKCSNGHEWHTKDGKIVKGRGKH